MDPSATKAILRVLGLCVVLLLLVAAATVSVAVMVWHSEAMRKLQGCREQAANETAMLGGRVAELERDRAELRARLEEGARREKLLQRQLGAAKDEGRKLNTTLLSCWEHVTLLTDNVTALRNEVQALQAEGAQMDTRNVAVEAELARGKETLAALQRQLEAARGQQRALRGQREQCEARQSQLQDSL
ncbi:hypothetical protein Y1Q_0004240 [Alligator mississippiensis]|uniref:Uncharacterized protein n=1 Tax=Alligator mississippiensis TaxID=8496 RepID=A0A151ND30_ALLMI|nr:hypothetical protein Y1Q_0004240 [Alligator mississippiensis]